MKNNDNLFSDFIALAVMAGIAQAFSEKKNTDNPKTETNKTEKKCECNNKSNCKEKHCVRDVKEEILKEIDACFGVINNNSDRDFQIIGKHLLNIIFTLSEYK